MIGDSSKKTLLLTLILFLASGSSAAPLEDAQFLQKIVNEYSPPLVISFLQSRMNFNREMMKQIVSSLTDLDGSKRDVFDLGRKILQELDNQMRNMEKSGYFSNNGTEKVKNFVEQYMMMDKLYPIEFDSSGMVNVNLTVDGIMEQLKTLTYKKLTDHVLILIENYLNDVEGKESSGDSNNLQRLTASLAKHELKSLIDNLLVIRDDNSKDHNDEDVNDFQRNELDKVLTRMRKTIDFFYSQFNHHSGQQQLSSTIKPKNYLSSAVENIPIENEPMQNEPRQSQSSQYQVTYVYDLNFDVGAASGSPRYSLVFNCD